MSHLRGPGFPDIAVSACSADQPGAWATSVHALRVEAISDTRPPGRAVGTGRAGRSPLTWRRPIAGWFPGGPPTACGWQFAAWRWLSASMFHSLVRSAICGATGVRRAYRRDLRQPLWRLIGGLASDAAAALEDMRQGPAH